MKNKFMKYLAIAMLIVGLGTAGNLKAATYSTNVAAGQISLLSFQSGTILSLTVANTSTNIATWYLIDAPTNLTTWTNAAYTNITYTGVSNIVLTYTNYFGVVTSVTNQYATYTTNSTAANTNNYNQIIGDVIPVGATHTINYSTLGQVFNNGILLTNNTNVTITIQYRKSLINN